MQHQPLPVALAVCRPIAAILPDGFFCLTRTEDAFTLVCETAHAPTAREVRT